MIRRILYRAVLVLALPIVLLTVWWFGTANSTDFYVPPLSKILVAFRDTWFGERMVTDVLPSLGRLGLGYLAALLLGVVIGTAIGLKWTLRALLEPVLEFLRAIPPPVLVPILILLNTAEGVRAIDGVLTDTCRSYRIGGRLRLWHLVLRSASPQIVTGARQALSVGIILMVISELFAASSGLGFTIVQFQRGFEIPEMWSGVLLLGLIGVVLSLLFRLVERWVLAWYHGIRSLEKER